MKQQIKLLIFFILIITILYSSFIIKTASAEPAPVHEGYRYVFSMEEHIQAARDLVCEKSEECIRFERYEKEYPIATQIWKYMKETLGYSDIVCAGILGNFMAETGGRTLKLNPNANGSYGLGLVQWIGGRRTAIQNKYGLSPTIEQQLEFMNDELFGLNNVRKQVSDSQLNKIMNASTPEECAYAFACYYERCAVEYRSLRRGLARTAYSYFTN